MRISAPRLRPALLAVPLTISLGGCMEWSRRPVPAPGRDAFFAGPVRVTREDGSILLLDNVTLTRDSVVGRQYAEPRARVALAAGEVRSVHTRRENAAGTMALVALATLAALGAYGAAMIASMGGPGS